MCDQTSSNRTYDYSLYNLQRSEKCELHKWRPKSSNEALTPLNLIGLFLYNIHSSEEHKLMKRRSEQSNKALTILNVRNAETKYVKLKNHPWFHPNLNHSHYNLIKDPPQQTANFKQLGNYHLQGDEDTNIYRGEPGCLWLTFQTEDRSLDALVIQILPYNTNTPKLNLETKTSLVGRNKMRNKIN